MNDINEFYVAYNSYCVNDNKFYRHTETEMDIEKLKMIDFTQKSIYEISNKPKGLWFSHGKDFFNWEHAEGFIVGKPNYFYELVLKNNVKFVTHSINNIDINNILVVKPNDVPLFHSTYYQVEKSYKSFNLHLSQVNNTKLHKDFGGVFFKHYDKFKLNNCFKYLWYCGLDGSSLVLWNMKLIKELKLLGTISNIS